MRAQWTRGEYRISDDKTELQVDVIHEFLRESYWSPGIPRELVERGIAGAMCFGIYRDREQVGFARVITDQASFGYLADVFVLPEHRGRGLSKWLMTVILAHPSLQGFRRWMLATRDAHALYARFGFTPLESPDKYMEKLQKRPWETTPS